MSANAEQQTIRAEPRPDCFLCGSSGEILYEQLPDRLFGAPGRWDISRCTNPDCRLLWLDPMPIEEDIGIAYRNYYTHGQRAEPRTLASRLLYGLLGLERDRRRLGLYYLDLVTPGRLLEVGIGDGSRLEALAKLGWQVEGQEVDPVAVANARPRGLQIHEGPLPDLGLADAQYDAIVGNHVLEHVHDPVGLLRECARLLRPGGRLVMITPNTDSYGHRVFRKAWRALEPPRHLHVCGRRRRSGRKWPVWNWTTENAGGKPAWKGVRVRFGWISRSRGVPSCGRSGPRS